MAKLVGRGAGYLPQILTRNQHPAACYFRTPFIARAIHKALPSLLESDPKSYRFSFQTSSLYDASIPSIPHFVYTDHTHKTNLYYPTFDRTKLFSESWIAKEKEIYENAVRVFTMSEHVRRSAIDHYNINPEKVECVFAGNSETDPRTSIMKISVTSVSYLLEWTGNEKGDRNWSTPSASFCESIPMRYWT